ncbi:hypothetical protein LXL04_010036 [Taraxacum kok-saghyz]
MLIKSSYYRLHLVQEMYQCLANRPGYVYLQHILKLKLATDRVPRTTEATPREKESKTTIFVEKSINVFGAKVRSHS